MEEQHILDSVVREALKETGLGEFSRSTFFGRWEGRSYIDRIASLGMGKRAEIKYTLGNIVVVRGDCFTTLGLKRKSDPAVLMTEDGIRRYETAEKKQRDQEDREYKRELAAWKERNAKLTARFKYKGRPLSECIGQPLPGHMRGVERAEYGILVDSYKDKEWRTAQFKRVVIQYVHPDAVMNITNHREATDMTSETLLQVMEKLKKQYSVETGYLNGHQLREYAHSGRLDDDTTDLGPLPEHEQNNIFQKEFKGTATVDDIVTAVKNVYAAGEAFKDGMQKLREERTREKEARKSAAYTAFEV